ncbi:hemerythrin HHE cation binding domain protein [Catonella morbi ATCC 51271]|uniref:Hemerythrin HHE cation binding domain protein n=1 Tax=Catonella morbi ATCC 51271 TaxID=592026 RepID=V2Y5N1_9FIRM|nr:DUF438 domain-containing protein [Catonella morbi]ESL04248.1 hemerythrin HHE cation binding domain protein [Catonella morbi ATCC 51271]
MSKKIDFSKTVFELTNEYPEIKDIMVELGFTEIVKEELRNSMGKIMTIPKGAMVKGIPMPDIIAAFMAHGFELTGEMPVMAGKAEAEQPVSNEEKPKTRTEQLKDYLKRLGKGEDLEAVRADFVKNFASVEASEIMRAEQELIKEGTPITEIQKLCDIHSALFHGATKEEKIANAEKAVEASLMKEKIAAELAKRDSFPKKDYSDKHERAAELVKITGHPLYTFTKENEALTALLEEYKTTRAEETFTKIRDISIHYAKKGDLLYPHLKVKYGVSGPSAVMWTVDDEIRDELGKLAKITERNEEWNNQTDAVLKRAEEMIYKEQNILFPICAVNFTEDEWFGIYQDSKDYALCFGVENAQWEEAENVKTEVKAGSENEIVMPGGHMTVPQLTALLNTIPVEITFIDENDINRFFNEGPKVFKRPGMAIDRDVYSCHPPKIEPMVRSILDDFKSGKRDSVQIWMDKGGRTMLVTYMAVRDKSGKYLGTTEVVQDMEFAKEHFQK